MGDEKEDSSEECGPEKSYIRSGGHLGKDASSKY